MKEVWKNIPEFEGLYQVSSLGKIRNVKAVMKQFYDKDGYMCITLWKNGKQHYCRVHRLVAKAFLSNPNNLPQINHKDENKTNNSVDNLEWCDSKYNNNYGTRREVLSKALSGEKNPMYGYKFNESQKKKFSELRKGKKHSEKTKLKISQYMKEHNIKPPVLTKPVFLIDTKDNSMKLYPSIKAILLDYPEWNYESLKHAKNGRRYKYQYTLKEVQDD